MNVSRCAPFLFLLVLWVLPAPALAQGDDLCPAIVQRALEATDAACQGAGRNQACYGNVRLEVELRSGLEPTAFDQPGDVVDVAGVQALRLSPLDEAQDVWGVALMRLQANLPDTLPGQNVTFLMFGDVEITNAVEAAPPPLPTLQLTANSNLNVRGGPSTNDPVVGGLAAGETVTANGRLEDGSWLRIELPDGSTGWVFAQLVTVAGDVNSLAVAAPGEVVSDAPLFNPMQAFYFRSGVGDAPCAEAPHSGILIQTPEGAGEITFTINEVEVTLASTAYVTAQPGDEMTIYQLENQARLSAFGVTQTALAGTKVRTPLNDEGAADGPPSEPEPYDPSELQSLPLGNLEREISVPPPLTPAEIEERLTAVRPLPGNWQITSGPVTIGGDCASFMNASMFPPITEVVTLTFGEGDTLVLDDQGAFTTMNIPELGTFSFTNPEPGLFVTDFTYEGANLHYEFRVLSPTQMEFLFIMNGAFDGMTCTITMPFTAQHVGD